MGPGFILSIIAKSAKTMTELRNAYVIKHHIHLFVMIGGILLLLSGLLMGAINPSLFKMGWYVAKPSALFNWARNGPPNFGTSLKTY